MIGSLPPTGTEQQGLPATQTQNPIEVTLNAKIRELTQALSQAEARQTESSIEKGRLEKDLRLKSKLLAKIFETPKPILQDSCAAISQSETDEGAEKNKKMAEDLQSALKCLLTCETTVADIDKLTQKEIEASKSANIIDAHYGEFETQKKLLLELLDTHLKPTPKNLLSDITSKWQNWQDYFINIRNKLEASKKEVSQYVKDLRNFIDYLEAHPIVPGTNSSIAQYIAMQDNNMISRLQYDVCHIDELVKTNSKQVEVQVAKNGTVVKELKIRHDKLLKQYVEVESLIQKIDLRLNKLSHHIFAHPSMLVLKDESTKFHARVEELNALLGGKSSLLNLVKQVLAFIIEYNGINPLFDEKYSDPQFKAKLQTIENGLSAAGINYKEDSEYCGCLDGSAKLPEKGLRDRKLSMNTTVAEAQSKLNKLLIDYDTKKMMESVFSGMKFYDVAEQEKITMKESKDFITELNDIKDLLVNFNAGWKQIEELFKNAIPDSMNFVCSSIMTNNGNPRSKAKIALKGVSGANTGYVLPA